ncbi:hypothetical protein G5B00_15345 [Parapedobacter sp. SGR-10]|uniref:hypothetical protein n=1 Tax=Parapedobacter sp. SGR-10 TaxID=2710879 RepID=UPI0013CFFAC8|nr:hypothetical protein [Parapedobacter sp. SGR-10]NGF57894.1 hypothetical protein [Parapedobacter sp. SGR-10]
MKNTLLFKIVVLLFCLSPMGGTMANISLDTDTSLFENQRKRVNFLLEERSRKFGEYDQSLQEKTGIFGLFKTKADMQKSIDILQAIAITDNNIFLETRKLLDLKDTEREHFQRMAKEFDAQVTAYMKTVSKLQEENDSLRLKIKELEQEEHSSGVIFYVLGLVFIGLLIVIYLLYKKLHPKTPQNTSYVISQSDPNKEKDEA